MKLIYKRNIGFNIVIGLTDLTCGFILNCPELTPFAKKFICTMYFKSLKLK